MGYLSDIVKSLNDNQDVIFVGTGMILVNSNGEILLASRTDNNQWCLPGGSLEVGESLTHCAVRETMEETGIQVKEEDLHLNAAESIPEVIIKNGRRIHIVSVSYWTKIYNDMDFNLDSREFTRYGWLNKEQSYKLWDSITAYSKVALERYYERLGGSSNEAKGYLERV